MEYREEIFENETVELDGNTFTGCTFRNCVLMFEATAPPNLAANHFHENVVFAFKGCATALPHLLTMLYQRGGEGGRKLVEDLFDAIRDGGYDVYTGA